MKTFRLLASMLVLPLGMAGAADSAPDMLSYRCERVKEVAGNYQRIADEYVELTLEQAQGQDTGKVQSRIHIGAASKEMTFKDCAITQKDGSNFSGWFASECRKLGSYNGSPYTIEPYLMGAYAGISPPVVEGYSMHKTLAEIGAKVGIGTPERTFVIYASRKPQYEFFCIKK